MKCPRELNRPCKRGCTDYCRIGMDAELDTDRRIPIQMADLEKPRLDHKGRVIGYFSKVRYVTAEELAREVERQREENAATKQLNAAVQAGIDRDKRNVQLLADYQERNRKRRDLARAIADYLESVSDWDVSQDTIDGIEKILKEHENG